MDERPDRRQLEGVFVGSRSAKILYGVIAGIFGGMLVASLALAFHAEGKIGPVFIGAIGVLLFAGLTAACLQNIFAALSTVRLSDEALRIETPLGERTIPWDNIASVSMGERESSSMRLRLRSGGSVPLRIEVVEDGAELGRTVRERVSLNPASTLEDRSYRRTGLVLLAFIGFVALLMYGGFGILLLTHGRPEAIPSAIISLIGGLAYGYLIANGATTFVRLTPFELTIGNCFGRRTYRVSEIQRLTLSGDSSGAAQIWVMGKPVRLPSSLEDWSELRERLVAILPIEQAPDPIHTPSPDTTGRVLEFTPRRSFYGGVGVMIAFFAGMTLAGLAPLWTHEKGGVGVGLVGVAVFGSMLIVTILMTLQAIARYTLDGTAIERKSSYKPWRIPYSDIEEIWRAGNRLENVRMTVHGKRIEIDTYAFPDRQALVRAIEDRCDYVGPPIRAGRYNAKVPSYVLMIGGGFFTLFPLAIATMPGRALETSDIFALALCSLFGLLLAFGGYAWLRSEIETTLEGVWKHSLGKHRLLKFADIERMEIDTFTSKDGPRRKVRIVHPEGGISMLASFEDFALIEAYLRAHLPSEKVHDATAPREYSRV